MLKSLKIENFRGFKSFKLEKLGRINLLVGENNSGKTSILEAVQLLSSRVNLEPLSKVMVHRGEYFWSDERQVKRELAVQHLFHGHNLSLGSQLVISGLRGDQPENLTIQVAEAMRSGYTKKQGDLKGSGAWMDAGLLGPDLNEDLDDLGVAFVVDWQGAEAQENISRRLSPSGGILDTHPKQVLRRMDAKAPSLQFVLASSLTRQEMIDLFNQIVLTEGESRVIAALQTIDPRLERIAPIGPENSRSLANERSGFVVRLADSDQRVPIGSLGDGIWRMLGLVLSAVNTGSDGVFLVDDIDTGLHFSTMTDMWRMIWKIANDWDIQVFATTHSRDCWESLAEIAQTEDTQKDGIIVHRIERDQLSSVIFNESEIMVAAQRDIEVR